MLACLVDQAWLEWKRRDLICVCFSPSVGFGAFGAVGFSYGGGEKPAEAAGAASDSGSESDSDDSDDSEEGSDREAGGNVDIEVAAAAFGMENFAAMLRQAEREEEAIANGKIPRRK